MCLCGLSHELVICGRLYVIVELGGLYHEDLAGEHTILKLIAVKSVKANDMEVDQVMNDE